MSTLNVGVHSETDDELIEEILSTDDVFEAYAAACKELGTTDLVMFVDAADADNADGGYADVGALTREDFVAQCREAGEMDLAEAMSEPPVKRTLALRFWLVVTKPDGAVWVPVGCQRFSPAGTV